MKKQVHHFQRILTTLLFLLGILLSNDTLAIAHETKPSRAEIRMVNLEATLLVRAIKHLKWEDSILPPKEKGVKFIVAGKDNCLFKERLSFLITEGKISFNGRKIEIIACKNSLEALDMAKKDALIMCIFLLSSETKTWERSKYPERDGLLIYGQGDGYRKKGLPLSSRVENNRIKLSVNLSRMNVLKLRIDPHFIGLNRVVEFSK